MAGRSRGHERVQRHPPVHSGRGPWVIVSSRSEAHWPSLPEGTRRRRRHRRAATRATSGRVRAAFSARRSPRAHDHDGKRCSSDVDAGQHTGVQAPHRLHPLESSAAAQWTIRPRSTRRTALERVFRTGAARPGARQACCRGCRVPGRRGRDVERAAFTGQADPPPPGVASASRVRLPRDASAGRLVGASEALPPGAAAMVQVGVSARRMSFASPLVLLASLAVPLAGRARGRGSSGGRAIPGRIHEPRGAGGRWCRRAGVAGAVHPARPASRSHSRRRRGARTPAAVGLGARPERPRSCCSWTSPAPCAQTTSSRHGSTRRRGDADVPRPAARAVQGRPRLVQLQPDAGRQPTAGPRR